jgi:hypothetical protein
LLTPSGAEPAQLTATLIDHTSYDGSLQDEICGHKGMRPSHERQHRSGQGVRRVGDQPERASGRNKLFQVAPNHRTGMIAYLCSKLLCPPRMQFDRDNPSASLKKWQGKGAGAGSQVNN